jgi:hypothetical protein
MSVGTSLGFITPPLAAKRTTAMLVARPGAFAEQVH